MRSSLARIVAPVNSGPVTWRELNRILFVAAAAVFLWLHRGGSNFYFSTIGTIVALIGAIPIFKETYKDISERRTALAMFVSAAILAALLVGNVFVAMVTTFFGLIAALFRQISAFRGGRAIRRPPRQAL